MWVRIFENYEASDSGLIRNAKTGRQVKQYVGKDGYLRTQIAGKTRLVHRLIAIAFVAADPGKDFVNHKDGNKQNNRACNLEWVTREENMIHAYSHGLKKPPAGEKNGRAKLSAENVQFIKDNYKKGDKERGTKALAEKFGVARQTVSAVISGQNW